ncbi:hypothetical protein C8R47DRAFT_1216768 [Mycena vitilis]|nr:hypothetical protein C8R47DRAFT_1216768 [Mycena vitilis]
MAAIDPLAAAPFAALHIAAPEVDYLNQALDFQHEQYTAHSVLSRFLHKYLLFPLPLLPHLDHPANPPPPFIPGDVILPASHRLFPTDRGALRRLSGRDATYYLPRTVSQRNVLMRHARLHLRGSLR